jgi:hypothetical protein
MGIAEFHLFFMEIHTVTAILGKSSDHPETYTCPNYASVSRMKYDPDRQIIHLLRYS